MDADEHDVVFEEAHRDGRKEGLSEALVIVEKIMRKPVGRDGSPSRGIQIRDALRALVKKVDEHGR